MEERVDVDDDDVVDEEEEESEVELEVEDLGLDEEVKLDRVSLRLSIFEEEVDFVSIELESLLFLSKSEDSSEEVEGEEETPGTQETKSFQFQPSSFEPPRLAFLSLSLSSSTSCLQALH